MIAELAASLFAHLAEAVLGLHPFSWLLPRYATSQGVERTREYSYLIVPTEWLNAVIGTSKARAIPINRHWTDLACLRPNG